MNDVLASGFIAVYVPLLASLALVLLREERGETRIMAFIVIVIVADTGAYASGLMFGKHKMAPRISPNKTWEGFVAAVASVIAGALLAQFLLGLPWWSGMIIGVVLLATATVGDLGESMSEARPGHQGR